MDGEDFVLNFENFSGGAKDAINSPKDGGVVSSSYQRNVRKTAATLKGSWKHKRQQARDLLRLQQQQSSSPYSTPTVGPESLSSLKRTKSTSKQNASSFSGANNSVVVPRPPHTRSATSTSTSSAPGGKQDSSFVSSLFTFNPEIPEIINGVKASKETPASSTFVITKDETVKTATVNSSSDDSNKSATKSAPITPTPSPAVVNSTNGIPTKISRTFEEMQVNPLLVKHLSTKLDITKPTKIQQTAIPALLAQTERDVLIKAQTGSGKTLTFLLPIIHRIMQAAQEMESPQQAARVLHRGIGHLAIVLAPTRELARQIYTNLESLLQYSNAPIRSSARDKKSPSTTSTDKDEKDGEEEGSDDNDDGNQQQQSASSSSSSLFKSHWIVPGIVVGGEKKKSEKARIRKGINILISTPGRLLDHLKTTKCFEAGNLRWLVLDEADRLLELGFEETLTEIIQILDTKARVCRTLPQTRDNCRVKAVCWPKERQTILCSATLSSDVKKLAETSLVEPIMIDEDTLKLQKQQLMHKEKEASKKAETLSSFAIEGKKNDVGVAVVATKNSVKQQLVDKQPSLSENKASSISTKSLDTKMDTKAVVTPALPTLIVSSSTPTELIEDEEEFMSIDTQQNKNGDNSDQEMDNQDSFNNIATRPAASKSSSKLQIPDQIKQSYLVVPAKLRLMALYSTLRHHAVSWKKSSDPSSTNMKIIVFMSSCDAVDFYHRLLTECGKRVFVREEGEEEQEDGIISEGKTPAVTKKDTALVYDSDSSGSDSDSEEGGTSKTTVTRTVKAKSSTTNNINNGDGPRSIVPYIPVLKLHGNLAQKDRMKMIREFTSANASILLCTDVAARGLDVPNVTHVIQYDPPTDINDYAHRVGRTARLGRAGEASIFFLPSEVEYLNTLASAGVDGLQPIKIENVVTWLSSDKELDDEAMAKWNNNFGAVATTASTSFDDAGLHNLLDFMKTFRKAGKMFTKRKNAEDLAMDVQMVMERYVLSTPEIHDLARSAFTSHIRSYATHGQSNAAIFHPKRLHLGHVAKSFALREAPSGVGVHTSKQKALEKKQKLDDERKAATGYSSYKRKSDAILRACADEFGDGNVRKLARLGSALTVREKSGIKQPIVDKDFKSGANKIVVKSRSMVGNVFNGKRTTFK